MTTRIYRVTVRGRFDGLTDAGRADLVARQPEHDLVTTGGFSDAGAMSYEKAVDFFTFRVQLRSRADDPAEAETDVLDEARRRAEACLADLGAGWRDVKVRATDLSSVWT